MTRSHFHTTELSDNHEITIWFSFNDWALGPRCCIYPTFALLSLTLGPVGISFTQWRPQ